MRPVARQGETYEIMQHKTSCVIGILGAMSALLISLQPLHAQTDTMLYSFGIRPDNYPRGSYGSRW
jgi:hypothetical protein